MNRRDMIALIGGAAVWPVAARGQAMPVIGFLAAGKLDDSAKRVAAFRQGLNEAGYVEGQNAAIEFRWANGQYDRMPELAADLARRKVSVIAASGAVAAGLAKAVTTTIPIVFAVGTDPVQSGLVNSLNRPGGNLTGVSLFSVELGPKRLELLHEVVADAGSIALLVNPSNPNTLDMTRGVQAAAHSLGLQLRVVPASTEAEIDTAIATLGQQPANALVVGADTFFTGRSEQLGALMLRHAVPAIFQYFEFAAAGGLMSYGGSLTDAHRLLGVYAGRILKGETPADLPVQQSTKAELIVNLKAAKALGLSVPLALLTRADEVIE
jgi:putative ABC transport system substrate-binding protein